MWWPFSIQYDDAAHPKTFVKDGEATDPRLRAVRLRIYSEWERFDKYYERNHRRYQNLRGWQIIVSALVPIFAVSTRVGLPTDTAVVLSGIFGAVATIFASLDSMYRSREAYLRSANARDLLSHELALYEAHAAPYDGSLDAQGKPIDAIAKLGANIERILTDEIKQYSHDEAGTTSPNPSTDGADGAARKPFVEDNAKVR